MWGWPQHAAQKQNWKRLGQEWLGGGLDPVGDSFLMKASVGPGSREPQEPRSLQAPPHLGCGWLSPGHRQPIQSQRGIHACGWVTLWGAFMGVGIRHQGKYMKGRHQCSPWSPWASRKGFLGDTALPRGLVQSLGSEACTQSFKALCSLCPPVHLYYGVVCSSLRCLDLPVSRPFLLLSSDPSREKLFPSGPEPRPQNEYGGTRPMNQTHSVELTHQLSTVSIKDSQSTCRPTTIRINTDF